MLVKAYSDIFVTFKCLISLYCLNFLHYNMTWCVYVWVSLCVSVKWMCGGSLKNENKGQFPFMPV